MTISSGIWALVPFKGATGAKRRLESVLDERERESLVLAMIRDVLDTLAQCRALSGTLLVSRDVQAFELAEEFGIDVFEDSATDLSGAVVQSGTYAQRQRQAEGTLFVPGDVPLIQPEDVVAVLDGHEQVTLVPDANDIGTNAAVSSPPNAFEYLFDGKSFKPHIASARRAGIEPRVVRNTAWGLDVDTVQELAAVARRAAGTRTGQFLESSGIAARLARAKPQSP
ncbi:MAG: 2-phospho-L-lactate guanylyltransferase [Gammaproteobacteria bacterium]|nr:2-phospho-L-lactate guanylyltransferase [Gammaproteobacteria bacterium]MYF29835.1 2-phospho-L-lactate guanylyltransferase [Gammaproteobacteria bacterium]MYK45304.1 2-phospho-L-lactate guanylyltransferase [Gammaproteobacteria bacterium]